MHIVYLKLVFIHVSHRTVLIHIKLQNIFTVRQDA